MKSQIIGYYITEKQWATCGLFIAIGFLAISVLLWKTSITQSMQRGLSYTIAISSFLFIIATALTIHYNNKRVTDAKQITINNEMILKEQEIQRMESVMKNAYKAGLTSFSIALITGIVLLLWLRLPVGKGIAWGIVLFGVYGLTMEAISMRKNKAHFEKVKNYAIEPKQLYNK